jgi:hypothetical protein
VIVPLSLPLVAESRSGQTNVRIRSSEERAPGSYRYYQSITITNGGGYYYQVCMCGCMRVVGTVAGL